MTETKKQSNIEMKADEYSKFLKQIHSNEIRSLLRKCYQCARCSGVCQLSKVQKFAPSRIIQKILEGFEEKVLSSGVLWECLMCNSCLQGCPEEINFADIVRNAKYKMITQYSQDPGDYTAHKGIYTSISELMSQTHIEPKRNLEWVPEDCKTSTQGSILYHIGCIPYFNFEFDTLNSIPVSTLKILCQLESEPIVVLENEVCCGHDLYWGHGNFKAFFNLAMKNIRNFEKAGISTIITSCAEGYRTFKIEYPKVIDNFEQKFTVKHLIEYVYDKWKEGDLHFKTPEDIDSRVRFTFHDPCRMSRFLPKSNTIMEKVREIFHELKKSGYYFEEMEHNKRNSLCCGVGSWMNCNERSKALRYKRLSEAKEVGSILVTSCPKCIMHFNCLQNDYEEISSIQIQDFSEFLNDLIQVIEPKEKKNEGI
ncbi:MAG: CoB--CoM heterodisulfide reductase iron-sulfur subunit D [Promethearchaeota archaeon]|nr:MAG: CoB--CoM heterodisulfide reductase iron-sulfur subunit D [Candidatus Lokiarchaeota archaeon]